ncbi:MAG: nucleotide 5'-monophosphate nucleosidase PpnN [Xanthomonadales bacterium]|nr:nucleotide 5'-monophosphate nucleosidase PpnN [Xanthomonadales bacterium]
MAGDTPQTVTVTPTRGMEILSQREVAALRTAGHGGLYDLFRRCCLAVLNTDVHTDDATELLRLHQDFDVEVLQQDRGIKLRVSNAPPEAFVDGKMIEGVREMLFDVLRDVVYINSQLEEGAFDLDSSEGITHAVFSILRHADVFLPGVDPNVVVCWGGHSIAREEYEYTKRVGYQLGLRGLHVCTGCGPGAMKGPMKGASVGHRKQRTDPARYVGISEPGIIAAESPNPIVNRLIIMPDIEKRLEAFVRFGHGIIVFPGGVGTTEEILYLLGILLSPKNRDVPLPLVFTGPSAAREYFARIDEFVGATLGPEAQRRYEIIMDAPVEVARRLVAGMEDVKAHRKQTKDAFFFNWSLDVGRPFQEPFDATHENMYQLELHHDQDLGTLAANLRRAFSGIVAGNVKDQGIRRIREHGRFRIRGDRQIIQRLDPLLASFVAQQRMKLPGATYDPCYEIVAG